MKKLLIASIASLTILSGCTTFDPYTGEEKTTNTAKGAGIGAGIAIAVSYLKNRDASSADRKKRMLKAAGIGAIAGGGVGYYMDTQEAKLRKQLRASGVSVEREGDNINLVMPGNITFTTNKADINNDFYEVLNSVALVLAEYDQTLIAVAGHTDSVCPASYNKKLSAQRASSVATYLKTKGIVEARIEVLGLGEEYPIADNGTAEGRAQNRRVELTLVPITEEE
jgi:outer membrane protein OmpA-like peptidoglycan-associated protein